MSKGLEALEYLYKMANTLSIIKCKAVNVGDFIFFATIEGITEETRFDLCSGCAKRDTPLTQEEYELLKEVLL